MQKKLLVLGGTGNTGMEVIKQSLSLGHSVTAIVRNTTPLLDFSGLHMIKGDILNLSFLKETLLATQPDAVITCLGVHGTNMFNRTKLYSESMRQFIAAMQATGVTKRIVCISCWGSKKATENSWLVEYVLKPVVFAGFIHDMAVMETLLEESNLDYTIVRPPGLTNNPATGKVVIEEQLYQNTKGRWTVTRADLAAVLIDAATSQKHIRQGIAVTNHK